jgi:hypothetical protein
MGKQVSYSPQQRQLCFRSLYPAKPSVPKLSVQSILTKKNKHKQNTPQLKEKMKTKIHKLIIQDLRNTTNSQQVDHARQYANQRVSL